MPAGGGFWFGRAVKADLPTHPRLRRRIGAWLAVALLATARGDADAAPAPVSVPEAAATVPALDGPAALATARAVAAGIRGARVLEVRAGGEAGAAFEQDAFLIVEPVRREALRVGDVVAYENPARHETVVHRLLRRDGEALRAARGGPLMRVFAIIYFQDRAAAAVGGNPAPSAPVRSRKMEAAAANPQ